MSVYRHQPPFVYFMRPVGQGGPVKIGCSQCPMDRLQQMGAWSPFRLEIAATTPGDEVLERRFHAHFMDQHCHNEWFHPSAALSAAISAIAGGSFNFDALPQPRFVTRPTKPRWTVEQRLNLRMRNAAMKLDAMGVVIPERVRDALYRYSMHGSAIHPVSRERADAEIIQAFLADHLHCLPNPQPLIAVSREAGFMLPRAA